MHQEPQKKPSEALARAVHEVRSTAGWQILRSELERIQSRLESEILDAPLQTVDNTCRYTRLDLLREMRRLVHNFIELPDDMVGLLEGTFEEHVLSDV